MPWLWVCWLLPALIWIWATIRYEADIPRGDQWFKPLDAIIAERTGQPLWPELFEQHNESRKLFPTVLSVGLAKLVGVYSTGWEVLLGMVFSLTIALCFVWFARRALPNEVSLAMALGVFFTWAVWGLSRLDLHFYSITFERLLPELCLLLGCCLAMARVSFPATIGIFCLLAIIGQYSYAGGFVVWPLLLALLWSRVDQSHGTRSIGLAVMLAVMGGSCAIYFQDFSGGTPPPVLQHSPVTILGFVCAFLGNPFASSEVGAVAVGAVLLVMVALTAGRSFVSWRSDRYLPVVPCLVLVAYTLSQATMAVVGRLHLGFGNATRSDYVPHAWYLPFACLVLLLATRRDNEKLLRPGCLVLGLALAFSSSSNVVNQPVGRFFRQNAAGLQVQKACAQLSLLPGPLDVCLRPNLPYPEALRSRLRVAASHQVLQPGPLLDLNQAVAEPTEGTLEDAQIGPDTLHVSGWALLRGRPADAVVVTQHSTGDAPAQGVVGVARSHKLRRDLRSQKGRAYRYAGWAGQFALISPAGCFRFWAYDTKRNRLHPLAGTACAPNHQDSAHLNCPQPTPLPGGGAARKP